MIYKIPEITLRCYGSLLQQISELGNKQTTTLVFENKEFNLKNTNLNKRKRLRYVTLTGLIESNAFRLASHVVQLSSNFSGSKSFYFSSSFDDELQSSALYR